MLQNSMKKLHMSELQWLRDQIVTLDFICHLGSPKYSFTLWRLAYTRVLCYLSL